MLTAKSLFPDGLLFASGNRNKFVEIVDLIAPLNIQLVFGPEKADLDVEETGTTYSVNARLKAKAWALAAGMPALADDSGVEVRALDWKPGIYSARMAKNDKGRIRWMLDALKNQDDRYARYVAAFALYFPREKFCIITEGECSGEITKVSRGSGGFGYDPIFAPCGRESTFGQIPDEIKRTISHRAIAGYRLIDILSRTSMIK